MFVSIKTQIIEVYRTPSGLRATVTMHPKSETWAMRIYNPEGTVRTGGNYMTHAGAMIALSRACGGKSWAFVGIESAKEGE